MAIVDADCDNRQRHLSVGKFLLDKNLDNFERYVRQSADNNSNLDDRSLSGGQSGLQNLDTIGQSGRRIKKSIQDENKTLYDGSKHLDYKTNFEDNNAKSGAENEFLAFFEKFKGRKKESDGENDTILEKNRKAKCFSELEVLGSKPKNVLKLKSFF